MAKNEPNKLVAVHQVFEGDIHGRALLIFPETRSLELVRAVTSGSLPLEDILELEQEALAETGNIILNGCLATIANLLQRTLKISLPEILRGDSAALFSLPPPPEAGDFVLFIYINFLVRERDIQGYIALLMDLPSLEALKLCWTNSSGELRATRRYLRMRDVTEENLSRILFDTVDLGIALLDCDQCVIGWNSWLASATGDFRRGGGGPAFEGSVPANWGQSACPRRGCFVGVGHVAFAEPLASPRAPAAEDPLGPGHDPRRDRAPGRLRAGPLLSDSGF